MLRHPFYTPTLSLHDALPICLQAIGRQYGSSRVRRGGPGFNRLCPALCRTLRRSSPYRTLCRICECAPRSEEHTSELQSHSDLVSRLLLEKKNTPKYSTSASM